MVCVVMRPFEGAEARRYQMGEVVDSSEWRNEEKLISLRYLQPKSLVPPSREVQKEKPPTAAPAPVRKKHERAIR